MSIKNITTQNQLQINDVEIEEYSSFDIFRKKIVISLVIMLLFFAYSDKIWAQIEGLYNSSTEQFAGISTLMSATANNDIDGVRFFSKAGPSVINQRNKGGATSLHIACREGNFEIAKILIDNGANVNIVDNEGWSPLMRASLAGKEDIVEILLKAGAKAQLLNSLNESALVHATSAKCLGCINKIVENGNLIKTMDTLVLKSQIADAFLVARSQENQQSQGVLESFLDYVSKISPLVLKNSTTIEEEPLPLLSNQTKISNSKLNKFPKNFVLKNQDAENLTPEQQNTYGVLEDPNLPAISKKNNAKQSEVYEQNIPLNSDKFKPNLVSGKSPTKFKFKTAENKKLLPQESSKIPNILTNNSPKEITTKPSEKIKYTTIINPQKQTLPKQNEVKKFKFKVGQTSIKNNNIKAPQSTNSNLETSESKTNINLLKQKNRNHNNQTLTEESPSISDEVIVDLEDKNQNNEYSEISSPNQQNQDSTIVLIDKNQNNKKKYSNIVNQNPKLNLTNSENKKVFKFKKNLNSESTITQMDDYNKNYYNSNNSSHLEENEIKNVKKFKLKKNVNGFEKNKFSDEQNEQNI